MTTPSDEYIKQYAEWWRNEVIKALFGEKNG